MPVSRLNAECVIAQLYEKNIIEQADWKRPGIPNNNYTAVFSRGGSNGVIVFDIEVSGSLYYISQSRVRIIAARYCFNADDLFTACAV
jgi:hypothetical protein